MRRHYKSFISVHSILVEYKVIIWRLRSWWVPRHTERWAKTRARHIRKQRQPMSAARAETSATGVSMGDLRSPRLNGGCLLLIKTKPPFIRHIRCVRAGAMHLLREPIRNSDGGSSCRARARQAHRGYKFWARATRPPNSPYFVALNWKKSRPENYLLTHFCRKSRAN